MIVNFINKKVSPNFKIFFINKDKKNLNYHNISSNSEIKKNILNICGEKFSGKSHLANIFCKKNRCIKITEEQLNDEILKKLKLHENIVLDNFDNLTEERLLYSLFNLVDHDNKYLLINSIKPINEMKFDLNEERK